MEDKEPYSDNLIDPESFLQDPKIIRCMAYISKVLTDNIESKNQRKHTQGVAFYINEDELSKVILPEGELGINDFCRAINACLELKERKNLTGVYLNKQLKKMAILGEEETEEGKRITVLPETSREYGIDIVTNTYNGRTYDKIVYDEAGKQFLLENLPQILEA